MKKGAVMEEIILFEKAWHAPGHFGENLATKAIVRLGTRSTVVHATHFISYQGAPVVAFLLVFAGNQIYQWRGCDADVGLRRVCALCFCSSSRKLSGMS